MNRQIRLQALSDFLKQARSRIAPDSVGLPEGTRRRTPGLRREEVAQLAGVSSTWYTWLEQGRDIKVSAFVLECISTALRLTEDERKYVFSLALESGPVVRLPKEDELQVSPSLHKIIQELRSCPAIISNRRCQIVGWNEAAAQVFIDFEQIPPEQRNMIRLVFARREFKRLAVNWEQFASGFLAMFRAYYGQYVDDDWYEVFLNEMKNTYPEFQTIWERSDVSFAPEMLLEFRHAKAGKMLFHLTSLQVHGETDLRCSIYTPAPDTNTEAKMKSLY
ncbi:helix-turn-helix transcriptional regulator [Paenibacillus turpanensis]|uniref:helix-turn-helix transcriptional regulator n=1 Tax=Paenibacillus turpanensis TaxID=2689078 RepID=UPI00140D3281|nr:helix-turn-helix transcriptional regulator [Paenibacillus turpanensis]